MSSTNAASPWTFTFRTHPSLPPGYSLGRAELSREGTITRRHGVKPSPIVQWFIRRDSDGANVTGPCFTRRNALACARPCIDEMLEAT